MPDWDLDGTNQGGGDIVFAPTALDGYGIGSVAVPVDATAPVVTLVSPPLTDPISRTTPIVVDVTDETALATVTIDVTFPDGVCELIYDGVAFRPLYAPGSTVTAITGGFRFTLRRARGGWPRASQNLSELAFNFEPVDRAANRSS